MLRLPPPPPLFPYTTLFRSPTCSRNTSRWCEDNGATGAARFTILPVVRRSGCGAGARVESHGDRKSTRLNSSHLVISYAVFCLKKKNLIHNQYHITSQQTHV